MFVRVYLVHSFDDHLMLARVKADLQRDLKILYGLAYRRVEKVGALLKEVHTIRLSHRHHPDIHALEMIRHWLLVPYTLWPVDFSGIGKHVVDVMRQGRKLEPDVAFLILQVSQLPTPQTQRIVAAHERRVEKGKYEAVIKTDARLKFREKEKLLLQNSVFKQEWREFQKLFDVTKFRDKKGIIRRRMVQERNFRPDWEFQPDDEKRRFRAAFDAFCHRWNLYGVEKNKPLVLKLTINLTAHGTMVVVPAFWSFDHKRDLDWGEIMKLHRPRVVLRQGPKWSVSRIERKKLARKTKRLWAESNRRRLKGDARYQWIKQQLGVLDCVDDREIRRLRQEAES